MGGMWEDRVTHVYLWPIHVDVWQKPSQYCKVIIYQLNNCFKKDSIESYGVVSEEVAGEMAAGSAKAMAAEVGVGISGIAGPTGGSAEPPVGPAIPDIPTPTSAAIALAEPAAISPATSSLTTPYDSMESFLKQLFNW